MNPSEAIGRTAPGHDASASRPWQRHAPLALLLLSLVVLYGPTAWSLAHSLWQDDTHSHGPLVLLAVVWLFWRGIRAHAQETTPQPSTAAGAGVLGLGLLIYVLGRSQGLYVLEVGSAIPVVLGGVLLTWGAPLARKLWFAFVFLLFLVPLPGSLIDTITQPMKIAVSWAAEHLMHAAGYPVARAGVVLGIGPYQLFVADACAGLNSLFMLEAFGLLYLNVVRHESALRNAVLAVLIVPISFVANVLRVVVLALVTYHFGDAAGQGFIHSFSGVVLFGVALVLTASADTAVRVAIEAFRRATGRAVDSSVTPSVARLGGTELQAARMIPSFGASVGAVAACVFAVALTPKVTELGAVPQLSGAIPTSFDGWTQVKDPVEQVSLVERTGPEVSAENTYDQVVTRAYAASDGQIVLLAIAYKGVQQQEGKIHRPEVCYPALGYQVQSLVDAVFPGIKTVSGAAVTGKQMHVRSSERSEAVSYWLRIGDFYSDRAWGSRLHILIEGLRGRVLDGVLVRSSQIVSAQATQQDLDASFAIQQQFLASLIRATSASGRLQLIQ